jgi:putative component of membrane protein insertase Oxa1/YidC/SpoIIIJ protein YidD
LLASFALRAIRGYQRYLSPYKGFSCAYRCATGRDGCSGYGYRVIDRFGLGPGLALLRRRLHRCGETHRSHASTPNPLLHYQRGECDLPCDLPCDASGWTPCDCSCNPLERYLGRKFEGAKRRWRAWRGHADPARQERSEAPGSGGPVAANVNEQERIEQEKIDLAYERYLLKRDGSVVTVPRLANWLGVAFSLAGFLLAHGPGWMLLAGVALFLFGCGLMTLSYRLKRKIVAENKTGDAPPRPPLT